MPELAHNPLIAAAGERWTEATRSAFLDGIADGWLPVEAFNRWLVQDYLFAQGLASFQAIAVAKTPRPEQRILVAGLNALEQELEWFEGHGRERGLALNTPALPTCRRYTDFLIATAYAQPFQVLLAVLFGVEAAYLAAWSRLRPAGPYAEFIARWSSAGFADYVRRLAQAAGDHSHADQQEFFNEVLRHERDFWRMTMED